MGCKSSIPRREKIRSFSEFLMGLRGSKKFDREEIFERNHNSDEKCHQLRRNSGADSISNGKKIQENGKILEGEIGDGRSSGSLPLEHSDGGILRLRSFSPGEPSDPTHKPLCAISQEERFRERVQGGPLEGNQLGSLAIQGDGIGSAAAILEGAGTGFEGDSTGREKKKQESDERLDEAIQELLNKDRKFLIY